MILLKKGVSADRRLRGTLVWVFVKSLSLMLLFLLSKPERDMLETSENLGGGTL